MGYLAAMQVTTQVQDAGSSRSPVVLRACATVPALDPEIFNSLHEVLDASVTAEIYREFLSQTRLRFASLAAGTPDLTRMREAAHTLKGTAGMLGAKQIAAGAERLESAVSGNGDAASIIRQILGDCGSLEAALRIRQVTL